MEPKDHRGYGALRVGRFSQSGSDYFLTGCLQRPMSGLTTEPLAGSVRRRLNELDAMGCWTMRSHVLMPDHFHLLATLGGAQDISAVVRLLKGPLTPALRQHGLRWQPSFYDHRLRSPEELLPTFRYIYLNPYRAGLVATGEQWPWYFCAPEDWAWFGTMTDDGQPFPEWLQ